MDQDYQQSQYVIKTPTEKLNKTLDIFFIEKYKWKWIICKLLIIMSLHAVFNEYWSSL